jgi:hypothetical protein
MFKNSVQGTVSGPKRETVRGRRGKLRKKASEFMVFATEYYDGHVKGHELGKHVAIMGEMKNACRILV